MTTLGAVFLPHLPPERLQPVARAADEAGLAQLWLWEDRFREGGIASAVAALASTQRLRVGVGVLPAPLRNTALTAMEIATVERMFPGRFVPGIGHGVQDWMGQAGARVASPLTLLREQLTAVRSLLRGDSVTVDGRYVRLDAVALDWPPDAAPRLVAAATGPKSLRLSGELADGTVLSGGSTLDDVRAARREIDVGRAAAGRCDQHEVIVYVPTATGADAEAVAEGVARWADAGADTVVLQPAEDEPAEEFVRFVARRVGPLLADDGRMAR